MENCWTDKSLLPMNYPKFIFSLIAFLGVFLIDAQELPKERFKQSSLDFNTKYENDSVVIIIKNPLECPIRVNLFSDYLKDKKVIDDTLKIIIQEKSEKTIKIFTKNLEKEKVNFSSIAVSLGDINKTIKQNHIAFPFMKGKKYKVIQSNQGSFSHDNDYSRFAVDFNMKVGDTITSADDGFVVGVIRDYEYGKNDRQWIPYANFITVYHPHSGLFTQYVHLKKDGSFVKVGDAVKRNQPIGLSGATGFVSGEHLHFNVLVPTKNMTLKSVPFSFENNISSLRLKKNTRVKKD